MSESNRSLFSVDNPDVDVELPDVADLNREDLERYQTRYAEVKTSSMVLKAKCTRLWKAILPHLDVNTNYFKDGITDAHRAGCIEHMHSIRHSVMEVSRAFLEIMGCPVVSDADVQTYDSWIGGWKDRIDSIINPIISPKPKEPSPQKPVPSSNSLPNPASPGVNVTLDSSKFTASSSLPPLKLKTFSGEYSEYHLYKAVFKSLMESEGLSEMQQACYLLDTLVKDSEAEKLVKYINPVQSGALTEMWNRLDEKYDKTPLGEAVYLAKLLDIAHWNPCSTDEDLKRLHDYVHENLHCLRKATGNATDGDAAKGHIWRLLPDRLKRKLTDLTLDKTTYSIDDVMKILKKQVIHNDRNLHLSGILDSEKPVPTNKDQRCQGCPSGNTYLTTSDGHTCSETMEARFGCLSIHQPHHCPPHSSHLVPPSHQHHNSVPSYHNSYNSHPPCSSPPFSCNNSNNYSRCNCCSCKHSSFEPAAQVNFAARRNFRQNYQSNRSVNPRPPPHCSRSPHNQSFPSNYPPQSHPTSNPSSNNSCPTSQYTPLRTERPPTVQSSSPSPEVCVFCDCKNHDSHECTAHPNPNVYYDLIRKKGLCLNCLQFGHIASNCSVPCTCKHACSRLQKHSTVICRMARSNSSNNMNVYSVSNIMHSKVSSSPVYMQTAMASISNVDSVKSVRARILPDSGSNKSYISEELANLLDLKVIGEFTCQMNTFGHDTETVRYKLVEFIIWYIDPESKGLKPVTVVMMTNPQMCGKVEGIPLDDTIRSAIRKEGFQLSDPEICHEGQFSIDILLGLDYYYEFINSSFHRISHGLGLLSTKFGEVLAGPSLAKLNSSNEEASTQFTRSVVNHVHIRDFRSNFHHTLDQKKFDTHLNSSPAERCHAFDNIDQGTSFVESQYQAESQPRVRKIAWFLARFKCFDALTSCWRKLFPLLFMFIPLFLLLSSNFAEKVEVNNINISRRYADLPSRSCFQEKFVADIGALKDRTDYNRTSQLQLMSITRATFDALFGYGICNNEKVDWSTNIVRSLIELDLEWLKSVKQFHFKNIKFCTFLWRGCFVYRKFLTNVFGLLFTSLPKGPLGVNRLSFYLGLDSSDIFELRSCVTEYSITGAIVFESPSLGNEETLSVIFYLSHLVDL